MSFRTGIILNWNSQDLKNAQQLPAILPGQLVFVLKRKWIKPETDAGNNYLEKLK